MKLSGLRLECPDTLGEVRLSLKDESGQPRSLTVLYGGAGAGKTTLLKAVGSTRPGHVVSMGLRPMEPACFAQCEWTLGIDEPDRGHSLVLSSPNAPAEFVSEGSSDPDSALVQRREAAFFERLAREGGFAFLVFSALRWFSRSPLTLHAPERGVARYDVKSSEPLEEASRHDLAREVKQSLVYAAIGAALPAAPGEDSRHDALGEFMGRTVGEVVRLQDFRYLGVSRLSLEPIFESPENKVLPFDALPGSVKHAAAIPALVTRLLWSAYPSLSPGRAPAVVAVDEIELHQDPALLEPMVELLMQLFPEVQWLLTTRSATFLSARDESQIFALRRRETGVGLDVHSGSSARVH